MSGKTRDTLKEKADAALQEAATKVIELARQTGTPVIVWEDGRIVEKSAQEAAMDLRKISAPQLKRDEGREVKPAPRKPRKTRKGNQ
jgi:hypothetical protein